MKKWQKILLGFFIFIGVVLGGSMLATAGAAEAGEAFWIELGEGDLVEAYDMTSMEFKAEADQAVFDDFVARFNLTTFSDLNVSGRSVKSEEGKTWGRLSGSVMLESGKNQFELTLVKEAGEWKVFGLNMSPPNNAE